MNFTILIITIISSTLKRNIVFPLISNTYTNQTQIFVVIYLKLPGYIYFHSIEVNKYLMKTTVDENFIRMLLNENVVFSLYKSIYCPTLLFEIKQKPNWFCKHSRNKTLNNPFPQNGFLSIWWINQNETLNFPLKKSKKIGWKNNSIISRYL